MGKLSARCAMTVGAGLFLGALVVAGVSAATYASTAGANDATQGQEASTVVHGADDDFDALAYMTNGADDRNHYEEGIARDFEQERAERYPYQYWTFATEKSRDGKDAGHSTNQGKVEGPWVRYFGGGQPVYDEDGHMLIAGTTWDKETNTWTVNYPDDFASYGFSARCYSCKSVRFNDMYEQYGSEAFGMPMDKQVMDFVGGEFMSCGSCHEDADSPTSDVAPQHVFWNTVIGDDGEDLSTGEKICGQCHNQTFFTSKCTDDEYFKSEKPFRYGMDADALIKAQTEDGMTYPDEDGISRVGGMHGDVELFHNSVHDSLGVDCVTCHMPQETAADGTVYTNHNASQSPLENTASLEACLSCHESQGIEDADAMVTMVRAKQQEVADRETALRSSLNVLEDAVRSAIHSGKYSDETLDTLRSNLFTADFYNEYCIGSYAQPGIKVAHNPTAVDDYLTRAEKLVADSFDLIEAGK